jgi:hypothetical protein
MAQYDWKHMMITGCGLASAACEGIAQAAGSGMPLPWHLAAATFLGLAMVFGHIASSLTQPTATATATTTTTVALNAVEAEAAKSTTGSGS